MARLLQFLTVVLSLFLCYDAAAQGFFCDTHPSSQPQTAQTNLTILPEASPARASITCRNPKIELTGKNLPAGATFWWQNEQGEQFFQKKLLVEQAGTFTFFVKNPSNGSVASAKSEISDARIFPKLTALGDELSCREPKANLHLAAMPPNMIFEWTGADHFYSKNASPEVWQAGNYKLLATEPTSGCTATASAIVTENKIFPKVKIEQPPPLNDRRRTVWLDATASSSGSEFIYLWWSANGAVPAPQDSAATLANVADTYTLLITNTLNGCMSSQQIVLQESGEAARTGAVEFLPTSKLEQKKVKTVAATDENQFSSNRMATVDSNFSKKEAASDQRQKLLGLFSQFLKKKQ